MTKDGKIYAGIDVGSRTTKALLWDGRRVVRYEMVSTAWHPEKSSAETFQKIKREAGIKKVERVVVTGYGRNSTNCADETITEITAHARGVSHLLPETHTLIDIGGQDSKTIILGENGIVSDFAMNDRCAAGSGKFLEFLALTMDLAVEKFADLACQGNHPVQISSICTVFAETEILSLLAEGVSKKDVARGVHRSIAIRVAQMAKSLYPQAPVAFSGGVANNHCMVKELSQALNLEIDVPEFPEYAGALGAAIIAKEGF